ncbi:hypothetical protein PV379_04905 [Streptomyces caniscabiei]|uniref:hypothetical protein n=1 Tax=Streptomyces caniscabiei TaxID=2746961 RepID=UPI0029B1F734|nr:hypothetical protein [Streptomyces caniscabiei]MDX2776669.1 hypothetical protein [Streptomyces caniscabiei]
MSLGILFAVVGSLFALGRIWVIRADAKRRPDRATLDPVPWGIWAVLTVLTLAPQLKAGSFKWAMLLLGANLIVNVTFLAMSLGHHPKRLKWADWVSIVIAVGSIILFLTLDNMEFALLASLAADFVGIVRTWIKASYDPDGEVVMNWVLALLASACTTACVYFMGGAVFQKDKLESWYPAYAVANATITVGIIMIRRAVLARSVKASAVPATEAA